MEMVKYYTNEGEILVDLDAPKEEPEKPRKALSIAWTYGLLIAALVVFWTAVYGVVALISNHSW